MKNRILFTILFCGSLISAVAQQRQQSSFDHVNTFNLNNAYAGFDSCMHVFLQRKQQWVGVDGAPVNTQLQGYMPLQSDLGVGLEISNWKAGLLQSTNVEGTVAKHLAVNEKYHVGAALSMGFYQYSFGVDDVIAFDNDNYLNQSQVNSGGFYGDLGVLFSTDEFQAGVSIPRLFASNVNLDVGNEVNTFNVERYFNAHASYLFGLNEDFMLQPMVIYRSIPSNGAVADIKAGVLYQDMVGLNLGYRTGSGLLAAVDFTLSDRFRFGYAYDAGMSNVSGISNGSHEFMLGFRMCKPMKKKNKEPEVVYYYANGTLTDAATGEPMINHPVAITNTATGITQNVNTDSTGTYQMQVDSGASYTVKVEDLDYETMAKTIKINPANTQTTANLAMAHKTMGVMGRVTDAKTKAAMSGVQVVMQRGEERYEAKTDSKGEFTLPLPEKKRGDVLDYTVTLKKEGYDPFKKDVKQTIKNYETVQLNQAVKGGLQLTPEKKPEQIAEIIDLNPITFQVNSSKLTSEATVEVDKVVKVLTENPDMKIAVGAHTDCTGGEAGNQRLSDARAETVVKYIQERISNPERVTGKGYGESQPIRDCVCAECNKEDHNINRRTEFRIVE